VLAHFRTFLLLFLFWLELELEAALSCLAAKKLSVLASVA
jgi:hypothetical protein